MFTTDEELQELGNHFLKKYFSGIPSVPIYFDDLERFMEDSYTDGDIAVTHYSMNPDYIEEADELYGQDEYADKYLDLGGNIGISLQDNKSWLDPLNRPDICIVLDNSLKNNDLMVVGTLLHELTHYYCWHVGLEHDDGSKEFEKELSKRGYPSNFDRTFDKVNKKWEDAFDYSKLQGYLDSYVQKIN